MESDSNGAKDSHAESRRNQRRPNSTATCGWTESGGNETTEGRGKEGRDHATAARGGSQSFRDEADVLGVQHAVAVREVMHPTALNGLGAVRSTNASADGLALSTTSLAGTSTDRSIRTEMALTEMP